jgi:hypothetical protein
LRYLAELVGAQQLARAHQRARALLAQRDALALEVRGGADARLAADDDMEAFLKQVGDGAQVAERPLRLEEIGAAISPEGDVGLAEAGIELPAADRLDIVDRALAGLGDGDQPGHAAAAADVAGPRARRVADDGGQHAADRKIGGTGRAGADAEEADVVGEGAAREQRCSGEERQALPATDAGIPSMRPAPWHHPPVHFAPIPSTLRERPAILRT